MRVTVPLRVSGKVTQGSCLLVGPVPVTRSCNYQGLTCTLIPAPVTRPSPLCVQPGLCPHLRPPGMLVSSAPQHSSPEGPPWCCRLLSPPAPRQHVRTPRSLAGLLLPWGAQGAKGVEALHLGSGSCPPRMAGRCWAHAPAARLRGAHVSEVRGDPVAPTL